MRVSGRIPWINKEVEGSEGIKPGTACRGKGTQCFQDSAVRDPSKNTLALHESSRSVLEAQSLPEFSMRVAHKHIQEPQLRTCTQVEPHDVLSKQS